ncbi:expressed protein, partial [Aureococcus anophagefferens]
ARILGCRVHKNGPPERKLSREEQRRFSEQPATGAARGAEAGDDGAAAGAQPLPDAHGAEPLRRAHGADAHGAEPLRHAHGAEPLRRGAAGGDGAEPVRRAAEPPRHARGRGARAGLRAAGARAGLRAAAAGARAGLRVAAAARAERPAARGVRARGRVAVAARRLRVRARGARRRGAGGVPRRRARRHRRLRERRRRRRGGRRGRRRRGRAPGADRRGRVGRPRALHRRLRVRGEAGHAPRAAPLLHARRLAGEPAGAHRRDDGHRRRRRGAQGRRRRVEAAGDQRRRRDEAPVRQVPRHGQDAAPAADARARAVARVRRHGQGLVPRPQVRGHRRAVEDVGLEAHVLRGRGRRREAPRAPALRDEGAVRGHRRPHVPGPAAHGLQVQGLRAHARLQVLQHPVEAVRRRAHAPQVLLPPQPLQPHQDHEARVRQPVRRHRAPHALHALRDQGLGRGSPRGRRSP